MPLYVTIRLTETSSLHGHYDPEKNRIVITEIKDGNNIAKALQSYLSNRDHGLPTDINSVAAVSSEINFTSKSSPWLKYVRIYGNGIEGLSTDYDAIHLSLDIGDMFWDGTFQSLVIGVGPYMT